MIFTIKITKAGSSFKDQVVEMSSSMVEETESQDKVEMRLKSRTLSYKVSAFLFGGVFLNVHIEE